MLEGGGGGRGGSEGRRAQNGPITIKLGMMVLCNKISQKHWNFVDFISRWKYDVIEQFLVSFKVEIRSPLFLSNLTHVFILERWSRIWTEKFDMSTIWARKMLFFTKTQKFWQILLNKSVAKTTSLVPVNWKLFQRMPYMILLNVWQIYQPTANLFRNSQTKPCKSTPFPSPSLPAWIR